MTVIATRFDGRGRRATAAQRLERARSARRAAASRAPGRAPSGEGPSRVRATSTLDVPEYVPGAERRGAPTRAHLSGRRRGGTSAHRRGRRAQRSREGGNAVDAAVAAVMASFVTESPLTGLGAGGYMLVHAGRRGRRARLLRRGPGSTGVERGAELVPIAGLLHRRVAARSSTSARPRAACRGRRRASSEALRAFGIDAARGARAPAVEAGPRRASGQRRAGLLHSRSSSRS